MQVLAHCGDDRFLKYSHCIPGFLGGSHSIGSAFGGSVPIILFIVPHWYHDDSSRKNDRHGNWCLTDL